MFLKKNEMYKLRGEFLEKEKRDECFNLLLLMG